MRRFLRTKQQLTYYIDILRAFLGTKQHNILIYIASFLKNEATTYYIDILRGFLEKKQHIIY